MRRGHRIIGQAEQLIERDSQHGAKGTDGIDLRAAFIVLPVRDRVAGNAHDFSQFRLAHFVFVSVLAQDGTERWSYKVSGSNKNSI